MKQRARLRAKPRAKKRANPPYLTWYESVVGLVLAALLVGPILSLRVTGSPMSLLGAPTHENISCLQSLVNSFDGSGRASGNLSHENSCE